MRTALLLVAALLLAVPGAAATHTHVHGEVAGIPFSVGPFDGPFACYFWFETTDLGVFYATGGSLGDGHCDVYVRAL